MARSKLLESFDDEVAWALLDAAPDGILIVDRSGTIVFASSRASEVMRLPAEELVGRGVDEFVPDDVRGVHRAHRARYQAEPTVRTMGSGLLLRARRDDGSEFPVEISLSPVRIGDDECTVAAVRDVSERVAAEDHLHRVLVSLDASDDAVFIFDADSLRYSYVNQGAVRLTGYTADDLLEMTPVHLNPHETRDSYLELVARLLDGPSPAAIRRAFLLTRDGDEVPVEKTYHEVPAGRDRTAWIVVVARDIRARLVAEEELRQSQAALREAEQVLAVADDRERIARDLHDTVIQRLFGAGLQLQASLSAVDAPARTRIEQVVNDLDDTIRELRSAIFALQGPPMAPAGRRAQLLDVVADAAAGLGFEPRLELAGDLDALDPALTEHLLAVLREALANVARHADATQARVVVEVDDEQLSLTVTDDGNGPPQEVLGGRGLTNLERRATDLQGTCALVAAPSGGARLSWQVPVGG